MDVILLLFIVGLAIWLFFVARAKNVLQMKFSMIESVLAEFQDKKFEQMQIDLAYQESVKRQYAAFFEELEKSFNDKIKTINETHQADFDAALKAEFIKACEKIDFSVIEYKKTITKKRRSFNKQNSHLAKPKQIWRSITDE